MALPGAKSYFLFSFVICLAILWLLESDAGHMNYFAGLLFV